MKLRGGEEDATYGEAPRSPYDALFNTLRANDVMVLHRRNLNQSRAEHASIVAGALIITLICVSICIAIGTCCDSSMCRPRVLVSQPVMVAGADRSTPTCDRSCRCAPACRRPGWDGMPIARRRRAPHHHLRSTLRGRRTPADLPVCNRQLHVEPTTADVSRRAVNRIDTTDSA
jgi:hypothetical protein